MQLCIRCTQLSCTYTAQTNAITNNAAVARLYLTHIVATPVIAVPSISPFPSNCSSKADAKARRNNAYGNVSVSVNWRSIVTVHTEEPGDTVSRQRGAYRGRVRWWMALWPRAPLTPRWSSETRGGRAQTESYTRLHRGKSGSLFPRGTLGSRKKPRLVLVLTWGSSRNWSAQVRLIDTVHEHCRHYEVVVCIIEKVVLVVLNIFVKFLFNRLCSNLF